ncbi:MAG TPA: hypothetical protein VJ179_03795 [Patescibacteria group bacterium]|nr:hypothetical protein [Patescibacteria group bacterium]
MSQNPENGSSHTVDPTSPEAELARAAGIAVLAQQADGVTEMVEQMRDMIEDFSILELFNTDPESLTPQHIELLNAFCAKLGITTDRLEAFKETEEALLSLLPPETKDQKSEE